MIFTPLRANLRPLYPVDCPVCGRFLGSMYKDGLSLRASVEPCTDRCVRLWAFARKQAGWRGLPVDLRQIQLAARLLDHEAKQLRST